MSFLVSLCNLLKRGLDALSQGRPIPAGVRIRFAGRADDFREIPLDPGQSHPTVNYGAPTSLLTIQLSGGKCLTAAFSDAILCLPNALLVEPLRMVLSNDTSAVISEPTLTIYWSHAYDAYGRTHLYRAKFRDTQDLWAFAECFRRNSLEAPSDNAAIDMEYVEDELVEICRNFEACLTQYGSFDDDEQAWGNICQACWSASVQFVLLYVVIAACQAVGVVIL
ncbi:uncharacterized protein B0H18DRAFT_960309 [Fomitopsis serialis]|uniref:uncharacterized protein n=1 Tax=Fomitopsis serialis TaxID=139415 RepID=UPI00200875B1|nr:uncharacterized protein B0H18DRAFT_960309 [Neoantrodia serialis]KAH9913491.1 hypothetical protein B0H18DRAFT_960309 [Neoantrodia serialis]